MAIRHREIVKGRMVRIFDDATHQTIRVEAPVYYEDHFLGDAVAEDRWTLLDTGAATEAIISDEPNGVIGLYLTNANEAQSAGISHNDITQLRVANQPGIEWRFKVKTLPTSGSVAYFGIGSALVEESSANNVDTLVTHATFKLVGSGAIVVESDDGTTDNDDVATGTTVTADDQYRVARIQIDANQKAHFFLDGVEVATSTSFDMSATSATEGIQPIAYIGKVSGTTVGEIEMDYVKLWSL